MFSLLYGLHAQESTTTHLQQCEKPATVSFKLELKMINSAENLQTTTTFNAKHWNNDYVNTLHLIHSLYEYALCDCHTIIHKITTFGINLLFFFIQH